MCSSCIMLGLEKETKFVKIHVTYVLHCKILNDNRSGFRMDSLSMVMKRINKNISTQQCIN